MSSFVKKINTGAPQLYKDKKGVKSGYANQQYAVSSGNPSLDQALSQGLGLPIGSLSLLLEDQFSHIYTHFQKDYLAEGIVNDQKCLIVDSDLFRDKAYWLKFLPAVYQLKAPTSSSNS